MNLTLFEELIFTSRAAERIIYGTTNYSVCDLYIDRAAQRIVVQIANSNRLIVLEAREFLDNFVSTRQKKATKLEIKKQVSWGYVVYNPENNHTYTVTPASKSAVCSCPDYQKQIEAIGRGCCKHGYRVLQHLGHKTLSEYIDANKSEYANAC